MELLLLITAWILKLYLSPVLVMAGMIITLYLGEFLQYCKNIALALDRFGNVIGGPLFNLILGKGFGNWKDTISYCLGMNARLGTLTMLGKAIAWVLNFIDTDHLEKSIDHGNN